MNVGVKRILCFLLLVLAINGQAADKPAGLNSYQVIIWSVGDIPSNSELWFQRLKETGITASMCYRGTSSEPYTKSGLGFYVENLVPELSFQHSRKSLYDADYTGYIADRSTFHLIRKPCFDDPAYWTKAEAELIDLVKPYVGKGALFYNLQDEPSIGSYASPMDYCFCDYTLAAFREWLKPRYKSLDVLNNEWETSFASWDQVRPMTTWEVKAREKQALSKSTPENYAPWADHREYMDDYFAKAVSRLSEVVKRSEPGALVGLEGLQMPSAWGGYDMWKLSRVLDWCEPYDIGCSRKVLRSFMPFRAPVMSTIFGADINHIKLQLWSRLLHGDSGCLIWDDDDSRIIDKASADLTVTAKGHAFAEIFKDIQRIAPQIMPVPRVPARVAVHYSQASIRAHWMFDSREDNDTWHRRFSSYESQNSRFSQLRESFVMLLEDMNVPCDFISYDDIQSGKLDRKHYDVLILPQSTAMSAGECDAVRKFVSDGGTVIADNMTATMDEHCKRLNKGQLDDLFGISQTLPVWTPEPVGGLLKTDGTGVGVYESDLKVNGGKSTLASDNGSPCVVSNKLEKGKAVYLNLNIRSYATGRYGAVGQALRNIIDPIVGDVHPQYIVQDKTKKYPIGVECIVFREKKSDIIAILHNPGFRADSLGAVSMFGEGMKENAPLSLLLPKKMKIRDIDSGKVMDASDRIEFILSPWAPVLFELIPI